MEALGEFFAQCANIRFFFHEGGVTARNLVNLDPFAANRVPPETAAAARAYWAQSLFCVQAAEKDASPCCSVKRGRLVSATSFWNLSSVGAGRSARVLLSGGVRPRESPDRQCSPSTR